MEECDDCKIENILKIKTRNYKAPYVNYFLILLIDSNQFIPLND